MQSILKWLRGLGPVGGTVADVLAFLTNNWVLTMSTVAALWAAATEWAVALAQNPKVQTVALVFLLVLWTSIGITVLVDRRRPRMIRPEHDYRYGLTFEGIMPMIYDPESEVGALQIGLQLRNFSSGPIRYNIDEFDLRIGTRALPKMKKGSYTSFMPRGAGRTSFLTPFSKDDIKDFIGKRVEGTANFSASYGHHEAPPVRQLAMSFAIVFEFNMPPAPIGFNATIIEESDVAI